MARVLVVDDNPEVLEFVGRCLERAGHIADRATNGAQALRRLDENGYDLVVTDIFMPDRDGLEVIRRVRDGAKATPIIAMSGGSPRAPMDFLRMARALGAVEILHKPFRPDEINGLVERLLPRDAAAAPPPALPASIGAIRR